MGPGQTTTGCRFPGRESTPSETAVRSGGGCEETTNLADAQPDLVRDLETLLSSYRETGRSRD